MTEKLNGQHLGVMPRQTKKTMTPIELLARIAELSVENVKLCEKKNADYANEKDAFANFRTAEKVGVSIERGMLVRMGDKLERISNLLKRPACVEDESVLDTCRDLSVYALLLYVYLEMRG